MNALENLPGISLDEGEPVFAEPWEANVFALVIELHKKGLFTWDEWAQALGQAISHNPPETAYYESWTDALEHILGKKSVLEGAEIERREEEWASAVKATPHGQPIELRNGYAGKK